MTNITLSVPDELKAEMDKFPEINWSEVARTSIKEKLANLNFLRGFRMESDVTPEEALELGKEVSRLLTKRYMGK